MKNRIGLLLALFVFQALLIAWLYFGSDADDAVTESFLQITPDEVTSLELTDGAGEQLALAKAAQGWTVGEAPADATKIDSLLAKLAAMDTPWPVATTVDTQARFEVSPENFQRRLVLTDQEGATTTLYLGSSPGFRRTHAREATSDAIYSIDFANHELPLKRDDWLDRGLLAVTGEVTQLSLNNQWQLTKLQSAWQVQDLATGSTSQAADAQAAATLVGRFADVQVLGLANNEANLVAEFSLRVGAGEAQQTTAYRLFRDEPADSYALARDGIRGQYTIANYIAEQMMPAMDDLLKPAESESSHSTDPNAAMDHAVDEVLQDLPTGNGR